MTMEKVIMNSSHTKMNKLGVNILGLIVFLLCFNNNVLEEYIPSLATMRSYGRVALILLFLMMYFFKSNKFTRNMIYLSILVIWVLISTFVNEGAVKTCIAFFSNLYLPCLFLEIFAKSNKRVINILNSWKWIIFILVIIDIITEIIYPLGMYQTILYTNNWFLGYKTERIVYSLPMTMMFVYTSIKKKNKIDLLSYGSILLALIDANLSGATAGSVMFLVILLILVLIGLFAGKMRELPKLIYKILDYRVIISLYVIGTIMVTFIQSSGILDVVSAYFMKETTFSGRTIIWKVCIEQITKSPVLGKGYMSSTEYADLVNMATATNAHSAILTLLMSGGVVALFIYFIIYKNSLENKSKEQSFVVLAISVFVYGMLLLGITSSTFIFSTFGMLGFWLLANEK